MPFIKFRPAEISFMQVHINLTRIKLNHPDGATELNCSDIWIELELFLELKQQSESE